MPDTISNDQSLSGSRATDVLSDFDRSLPLTLEYTGEFGPELVLFLPFVNWLSKLGLLRNRRVISYKGMRCFYDELDCLELIEKASDRCYMPLDRRPSWLPVQNEHDFDGRGRSPQHLYPDLREKFGKLPLLPQIGAAARPLLIIHNKYNNEWNEGAINYISVETLKVIFESLGRHFTIVYIRHGMSVDAEDFVGDHNVPLPFDDRGLLDDYPQVLCFDDLYAAHRAQGGEQTMNAFKNVLYSRCHRFISSQGGGTCQIALYAGSLLVVLHRRGSEEQWAYGRGHYRFMASVPPHLAVCRTQNDLLRALPLFVGSTVVDDRVFPGPGCEVLLAELSPLTIARRHR